MAVRSCTNLSVARLFLLSVFLMRACWPVGLQVFWVMGFYWVAEECRRRRSAAAAFNGKGLWQVMESGQLPASSSEKWEVSCGEHREEGESSRERRTGKLFRRVRH